MFDGKLYELDKDEPFSGLLFNTYPSGKKEYEGEYKNGIPNGPLIYWYENGNKMREGILNDGSPLGEWKYYNKQGILENKKNY